MTEISPARAFPFTIVGFDLDGTLLDTGADLAAAANHALAVAGRSPLPVAEVVARVGGGTRAMLTQVLGATGEVDEPLVDRLLPELLGYYQANMAVHTRPYPGVRATLDALAARGVRLGVVTNKLERFATALLAQTGLADPFACVIGGDSAGVSRPKPAPDAIVRLRERLGGGATAFVGDSRFDVAAAAAAGVPVIACRFGFAGDEVDTLGADAVIDGFGQLLPALERL
jgi:phosphoglycolate phosphatase